MGGLSHTVSGDIASFRTPSRVPIESLKFHFLPKQAAGTPSPENPISIEGWTGLNGEHSGKNLLDTSTRATADHYELNGITFDYNSDGSLTVNGKVSDSATTGPQYRLAVWTQKVTGNYYICANAPYSGTYNEIYVYDSDLSERPRKWDGVTASQSASSSRPLSEVRLLAGHTYSLNVRINRGTDKTYSNDKFYPMLLPYWCTDTTFEPYSGELIPITFPTSKNLLDVTRYSRQDGGKGLTITNGTISFDEVNGGNSCIIWFEQMFSAGTYTLNAVVSGDGVSGFRLLCSSSSCGGTYNSYYKGYFINSSDNNSKITFTVTESFAIGICLLSNELHTKEPGMAYNIQLEQGSDATSYESYVPIFYGGYIDPVAGEIVAGWRKIFLKNRSWYNYSSFQLFAINIGKDAYSSVYSSHFPVTAGNDRETNEAIPTYTNGMSYAAHLYFWKDDGNFTSATEFQNWINNLEFDPYVVYKLAEPIRIPITPQDLKAFLDHNNFWSDANDITEVTYAITESKDILAARKKAMDFDIGHHKKVKWNQLIVDGQFTDVSKWTTNVNYGSVSVNNNIGTWTCAVTPDYYYRTGIMESREHLNIPETHKILMRATVRSSVAIRIALYALALGNEHSNPYYQDITVNEWTTIFGFVVQRNAGKFFGKGKICYGASSQNIGNIVPGTTLEAKDFMMFDLTQMFGLGNEPQTVAEFERICALNGIDLTTYQPYDAGSDRWLIIP